MSERHPEQPSQTAEGISGSERVWHWVQAIEIWAMTKKPDEYAKLMPPDRKILVPVGRDQRVYMLEYWADEETNPVLHYPQLDIFDKGKLNYYTLRQDGSTTRLNGNGDEELSNLAITDKMAEYLQQMHEDMTATKPVILPYNPRNNLVQ